MPVESTISGPPEKALVVIVGAGPAGSSCASRLAQLGVEAVVLDKHHFPRRKACAGGLSPAAVRWLKELGAWDEVVPYSHLVTGLRAVAPSGRFFEVKGLGKGYVIHREKLDSILFQHAASRGAKVWTGEKVVSLLLEGGSPTGVVTEGGRRIEAVWTVLATGAGGGRLAGDGRRNPLGRVIKAVMTRYEGMDVDERMVEMYFDREIAPFYGWVFPEGGGAANVGLGWYEGRYAGLSPGEVYRRFERKYLGGRLSKAKRTIPLFGAPIHTTFAPAGIARGRLLIIGEAGWLVNPATGEGISQAVRCGVWAAQAIADHLKGRKSVHEAALFYETCVKSMLRPRLLLGELGRFVIPPLVEILGSIASRGSLLFANRC